MTWTSNAVEKPALSQSSLSALAKCGILYQYRYVDKLPARPRVAMVEGTVVHQVIQKNLIAKRETGKPLSADVIADLARESLDATWYGEEPELSADEKRAGTRVVKAASEGKVLALSRLHAEQVAPRIDPLWVERKFRLSLPSSAHDLSGVIDIQTRDGWVRDTKTTGKSPSADAAESSLQLTMYGLAVRTLDTAEPVGVALDFLVDTKTPKVVTLESKRTADDYNRLLLRASAASRVILAGAFAPTTPDNWWCSEKWCAYWNRCPFGARQTVSVSVPVEV